MFELTNEQRRCFALVPVNENWERIKIKASPYDSFATYAYCENNIIKKCITVSDVEYSECELCEALSEDGRFLLPKTPRGKPVLLSSSNLLKRTCVGMVLNFNHTFISLYNSRTECSYYSSSYESFSISDINAFEKWVIKWCDETTEKDISDIESFAKQSRKHVRFKEGDVFRFKLDRRLYG